MGGFNETPAAFVAYVHQLHALPVVFLPWKETKIKRVKLKEFKFPKMQTFPSHSQLAFVDFAMILLDAVLAVGASLRAFLQARFAMEHSPLLVFEKLDFEIAQMSPAADALR